MLDSFLMFTLGYLYAKFYPRIRAKLRVKLRLRKAAKIMKRVDKS